MFSKHDIISEWQKVKDSPSLYKHYGTPSLYMAWRQRFMRMGLLKKGKGGWRKRGPRKIVDKAAYSRNWRRKNPGKSSEYVKRYWVKKLKTEAQTVS